MALGQVYTFGPTFRAENSNTSATWRSLDDRTGGGLLDLASNMKLAEIASIHPRYVVASCDEDLEFLENRRFKLRNSCRRTNATMRRCAPCRQSWIRHSSTSLHRGH